MRWAISRQKNPTKWKKRSLGRSSTPHPDFFPNLITLSWSFPIREQLIDSEINANLEEAESSPDNEI
jgi:hypothetical protein